MGDHKLCAKLPLAFAYARYINCHGFSSSLEDLDPITQGGTYYGIATRGSIRYSYTIRW